MVELSPTIGSIDGIKIQLHWSFILLLLFLLIFDPYLFIIWVLLFVCVLIHELTHSITSRRNNIPVKKIILYPFGGGSIIDFEKVKPDTEFKISIVGPIASLLIGTVVGILVIFTPAGFIKSTLQILFILNIFLGIFNLVPWFPLDGGRALRSYLQGKRSFLDATKLAVKISNIITVLFIIATIVYALLIPGYSFAYREIIILFDIIVAMFIYGGAKNELQSAFIKEKISDLKAIDAITKNYVMIKSAANISDLYHLLKDKRAHIVLFKSGGKIKIISNSMLQKLTTGKKYGNSVEEFGTEIPVFEASTSLYSAIEHMQSEQSNIAAVTKRGRMAGVLLMQHIESIVALHMSQKPEKVQKA